MEPFRICCEAEETLKPVNLPPFSFPRPLKLKRLPSSSRHQRGINVAVQNRAIEQARRIQSVYTSQNSTTTLDQSRIPHRLPPGIRWPSKAAGVACFPVVTGTGPESRRRRSLPCRHRHWTRKPPALSPPKSSRPLHSLFFSFFSLCKPPPNPAPSLPDRPPSPAPRLPTSSAGTSAPPFLWVATHRRSHPAVLQRPLKTFRRRSHPRCRPLRPPTSQPPALSPSPLGHEGQVRVLSIAIPFNLEREGDPAKGHRPFFENQASRPFFPVDEEGDGEKGKRGGKERIRGRRRGEEGSGEEGEFGGHGGDPLAADVLGVGVGTRDVGI